LIRQLKIIFSGGGTGGHLYPAVAVAKNLEKKHRCSLLFVGTKKGIESTVIPDLGYNLKHVWISGIARGRFFKNILFPLKMAVSFLQSTFIILGFKPHAVIGTGGYASWPVLMAAHMMRIPVFLQEQNIKPGLVTKSMSSKANTVYLSYAETEKYISKKTRKIITGNPTRDDLGKYDKKEACRFFNLDPDKKTVFVFGGSQGSLFINNLIKKCAGELSKKQNLQILWAAGPRWAEELRRDVKYNNIHIVPFIKNMAAAYGACDLAVCRSGATTIAELTRLGIPAVFIPFARAADNHQQKNAELLYQKGAAYMITEKEAAPGKLVSLLDSIVNDPEKLKSMSEKSGNLGKPDAAGLIADDILNVLKRR